MRSSASSKGSPTASIPPALGPSIPHFSISKIWDTSQSKEQDGKRIYTITAEGLKFLEEQAHTVDDIKDHMRSHWHEWGSEFGAQFREVMLEYGAIGRVLGQRVRRMSSDKLPRIGAVLKNALAEIEKIVSEEPSSRV